MLSNIELCVWHHLKVLKRDLVIKNRDLNKSTLQHEKVNGLHLFSTKLYVRKIKPWLKWHDLFENELNKL